MSLLVSATQISDERIDAFYVFRICVGTFRSCIPRVAPGDDSRPEAGLRAEDIETEVLRDLAHLSVSVRCSGRLPIGIEPRLTGLEK